MVLGVQAVLTTSIERKTLVAKRPGLTEIIPLF